MITAIIRNVMLEIKWKRLESIAGVLSVHLSSHAFNEHQLNWLFTNLSKASLNLNPNYEPLITFFSTLVGKKLVVIAEAEKLVVNIETLQLWDNFFVELSSQFDEIPFALFNLPKLDVEEKWEWKKIVDVFPCLADDKSANFSKIAIRQAELISGRNDFSFSQMDFPSVRCLYALRAVSSVFLLMVSWHG